MNTAHMNESTRNLIALATTLPLTVALLATFYAATGMMA